MVPTDNGNIQIKSPQKVSTSFPTNRIPQIFFSKGLWCLCVDFNGTEPLKRSIQRIDWWIRVELRISTDSTWILRGREVSKIPRWYPPINLRKEELVVVDDVRMRWIRVREVCFGYNCVKPCNWKSFFEKIPCLAQTVPYGVLCEIVVQKARKEERGHTKIGLEGVHARNWEVKDLR